jgi:16S rRNA (uracil1498-N3)-methyltransferase
MVRMFVPAERLVGDELGLTPDEAGYLVRVRRLAAGDSVEIFDGHGGRWPATLKPGREKLGLGPRVQDRVTRRFTFELWQGLPKGERMEWVIQKATELGAERITPLACERSVVKLVPVRAATRLARWRRIAQEAARQCGRADVPEVGPIAGLSDLTSRAQAGGQIAVLYEREDRRALPSFLADLSPGTHLSLVVGPEGGFDPREIEQVSGAGIPLLGLGDRMLRTETAAVAVCVLALAASGGMGGPAA